MHEYILQLEERYAKEADGYIAAARGFEVVASMGPAPRVVRVLTPPRTTASTLGGAAGSKIATRGTFGPKSLGAAQAPIKLTRRAARILGNIRHLKDVTVREAIRTRGGTAQVVREAGDEFAGR